MTADRVPPLTHPAKGVAVLDRRQVALQYPAKGVAVLDRRQVALHKIGAKAEQVAGFAQIVKGDAWLAETPARGRSQPVGAEQIKGEVMGRAERAHEIGRERRQGATQFRRNQ